MKKGLKIFLVIVGVIVGLLLLVNIIAGPIVKTYAEKHSLELCHRIAKIKHVRLNIFTGRVTIVGLDVKEENGKERFLYFDKLKVRVSLPRLLGKTVRINKILLNGLDAQVIQDGAQFNFSDIIDFYTKDKKDKPEKEPSKWSVDIRNIHVKNSAVLYEDKRMGSKFDTRDVNIKVPRLNLKEGSTRVKMTTAFKNGGDFALKGGYDIQKGDFDAKVNMHDLSLVMAWPYLRHLINVGSLSGKLQGDALVKGCVKHIQDMVFSGTVGLTDFKAVNADKSPLTSFSSFNMNLDKVDLGQKSFKVNSLSLNDLVVNYDIYQEGNTITRLLSGKVAKDSTVVAEESPDRTKEEVKPSSIQYVVKNLLVTNGKIRYADHSVSPQVQNFEVSGIQLKADNLSNGKPSPVTLKAKLGSSGELVCNANVDPLNLKNADAKIDIKNLNITDFTPYSLYYLAYPVEDGLLAFTSDLTIRNNMLDSRNLLDIYKPTFGKKDKKIKPAAAKIPMKAAMYIVTDRKGHVKMELPVKGDISSPEFSFGKVIWKTFLNLVVKIAASPVDFIAKALAGDETFKPMLMPVDNPTTLTIEHTHQLNEIAEYLKEKKELGLQIFVTPHAESGLSAKKSSEIVKQCFQTLQNHLVRQGVSRDRIVLVNERKEHKSKGNVEVNFDLKYPEE